jgi:hypothetical protein
MDQDYVLCEAMSRADVECHIKRLRGEGNVAKADALEEWDKEVARTAREATPFEVCGDAREDYSATVTDRHGHKRQ